MLQIGKKRTDINRFRVYLSLLVLDWPTQLPTQGQWWSNLSTQLSQMEQWDALQRLPIDNYKELPFTFIENLLLFIYVNYKNIIYTVTKSMEKWSIYSHSLDLIRQLLTKTLKLHSTPG